MRYLTKVSFVVLACMPDWVQADVYDLAADWSDAANPNGVWSCNSGTGPITTHQSDWLGNGNAAWADAASAFGHVPMWLKSSIDWGPTADVPRGVVMMHCDDPCNGIDEVANVTWTSPVTASAAVTGALWFSFPGSSSQDGRSMDWGVKVNGEVMGSGAIGDNDAFDSTNPATFSFTVPVVIGDVIRLEFQRMSA
jgi:hypothetical protein